MKFHFKIPSTETLRKIALTGCVVDILAATVGVTLRLALGMPEDHPLFIACAIICYVGCVFALFGCIGYWAVPIKQLYDFFKKF